MPDYLLPCKCGTKTPVSTARAGEVIRCACGAELQVPSMRGLRELEPADPTARTPFAWNDRHRVAFLLIMGAVACTAVAGYLWLTLPVIDPIPTAADFHQAVEGAEPAELLSVHHMMMEGLHYPVSTDTPEAKTRQMMLWGIAIVSILAVALLGSAWITVFNRPRPKPAKATQPKAKP